MPQKITFKNNIKFSKKSNIPKLDLTSAIKIQEANLQRINQLKNKDIISVTEQLEKIQKFFKLYQNF